MINEFSISTHSIRGNARKAVEKGSPRKGSQDCGNAQAVSYYCMKILCAVMLMRLPAYRIVKEVPEVVLYLII
jgi:hypothetical protein